MNNTISYYNKYARKYSDNTINIDMSYCYKKFLSNLKTGSHILDLGCGSGRDSLYFIKNQYKVTAIEGSIELSKIAAKIIGQPVININFLELKDIEKYDGIWACSSLLHINRQQFICMLDKLYNALKNKGIFYLSLKLGEDIEEIKEDRLFTYYSNKSILSIIQNSKFTLLENFTTISKLDNTTKWINLILSKKEKEIRREII